MEIDNNFRNILETLRLKKYNDNRPIKDSKGNVGASNVTAWTESNKIIGTVLVATFNDYSNIHFTYPESEQDDLCIMYKSGQYTQVDEFDMEFIDKEK